MADFALELLKFTPPKESNIMSPLSLVAALSVLERAAGGSTKSQIANALRRTSDADVPELIRALAAADGVLMAVATKFYLANGTNLHEDYKSTVTKEFDVATECLDFRNQKLTVEVLAASSNS
ncbi:unnamed protein product [Heligmosomoides polygyrus]|uniref:SERPIN domain-containing protein n=1 Tax=Heligmosomoides polygyrus TaxID=6339 RepID=A0A183FBA8_HELPZ|nr:unnamed protein product [Heligmosomoides polygyrus]